MALSERFSRSLSYFLLRRRSWLLSSRRDPAGWWRPPRRASAARRPAAARRRGPEDPLRLRLAESRHRISSKREEPSLSRPHYLIFESTECSGSEASRPSNERRSSSSLARAQDFGSIDESRRSPRCLASTHTTDAEADKRLRCLKKIERENI